MYIKVVGPCAAGKTTLVGRLRAAGYDAHHCLQEHSYVPDMWQRVNPPDVLIFLDARLDTLKRRRPRPDWSPELLAEQQRRLAHARAHCDLYLATDDLTPEQVYAR
ncbi:MAG: hypothetical protein J7M34_06960, partial [Anaerolineae bacterium]|nr:hypothetical protein [Anaerolineae bacterium]